MGKTKKQRYLTSQKCEDGGNNVSAVEKTDLKRDKKIKKKSKQGSQINKSPNTIVSTDSSFFNATCNESTVKFKRKSGKLEATEIKAYNEEVEEKLEIPEHNNSELNIGSVQEMNGNVDEEEFDPNELDAYCDDVTEEDNAIYLNWVQLLEEKLHPKKSTSDSKTDKIKKNKSSKKSKEEQQMLSRRQKKKELAT